MSMIPKRLLATAALGAALAITGIGETKAMQIPVTTANAIASPALNEQVQWRGYGWRGGWRGGGWRGYGWRGYGWRGSGWGGGAVAAGLIAGGLIGAAAQRPIMAIAMATQPITAPPSTTATRTLTVRAITDIDGHSTGPTGGIGEPTTRGPIIAAGVIAAPM